MSIFLVTTQAQPVVVSYTYDTIGRLNAVNYTSGQQVQYTFDGAGNITKVAAWSGTEPAQAPAALTVPALDPDGAYSVTWKASTTTGVTYVLEEATAADFSQGLRTAYKGIALTAPITGRMINTTYYYRVKATKTGLIDSPWTIGANGCSVMKALLPPATVTVPTSPGDKGFEIRWAASTVAGAQYVVQVSTSPQFTSFEAFPPTSSLSMTYVISSGMTLYFRVKTVLPGYTDSPWKVSTAVKVLPAVGAPASLAVPVNDPDGAYTVNWGASSTSGVTYVLEEATDPDFNLERRTAYSGTQLQANITGRVSAKIYYYRVLAKKSGFGNSAYVVGTNGCAMNGAVAAPGSPVVPLTDPDGGYTVSWAKSATSGVTYTLEEASLTDFSNSSVIYTGTLLSKAITGKTAGTYYYRVKATRSGYTETAWIKGANGCMVQPVVAPPTSIIVPVTGGTEGYTVGWGASPTKNVTYILEEANNPAFTGSTLIYSGSTLSKRITGKAAGSSWYYRVKAYLYGYAASAWKISGKVSVLTSAGKPGSITVPASDDDGSYVVQWTASPTPGVTYILEEATNADFTAGKRTAITGTGLSAAKIVGRTRGLTYYYRIKTSLAGYADSEWLVGLNGCTIMTQVASPGTVVVPATAGHRNVTVSWGKSATDGVTYTVEVASDAAFTYPEEYWGIKDLSFVYWYPYYRQNTNATRYFRVKACKAGFADSGWKNGANMVQMLAEALPPAGLSVPASDPDGAYIVSWETSPTSGASYILEEAQDELFTVGKRTAYTGTLRTTNITGRTVGKTYFYRVKAKKTGMSDSIWITHDPASGLTGVQKIVQGYLGHNLALMTDKTVYAWGNNREGQLGASLATLPQGVRTNPAKIQGLDNVVDIAAGVRFSIALKTDGTVWTWGDNSYNQLGDGSEVDERFTPQQVPGLSGVIKVAAGNGHALALKNDGTVWAWGSNYSGQLGDGTTVPRATPVQVLNLANVKDISAGWYTSMALLQNGSVWTWGDNEYGSLGTGSTSFYSNTPVVVSGLPIIAAIDAGSVHNLTLGANGSVWAWGGNGNRQLGDGTNVAQRTTPVQVSTLTGVSQIAAGWSNSFALTSAGVLYAWGGNHDGELGLGTDVSTYNSPIATTLSSVKSISAGGNGVAILQDGTVKSWGYNWDGAVGDGTLTDRLSPVYVAGPNTNSCQVIDADTFGIWNFNECDGKDSSGNGRDAAIHGTECSAGHNGNALHFSNSANTGWFDKKDWVTLPNITANSLTFRAWIKWQQANNYDPSAAVWSVGDNSSSFLGLFVNSNEGSIRIIQGNNTYSYSGQGDISDGGWHYVEVIANPTSASFYLDHQIKGMTTLQNPISFVNAPQYLSYHQWYNGSSSSSRFYGYIDEVQVINSN